MASNREERRARAEARAQAAQERAEAADQAYESGPWSRIPTGQPILVGHHSERRHRRDIERMDQAIRKSVEADRAAKEAEYRARNSGYAIQVTDDDAVEALKAKIEKLEAFHAYLIKWNRAHRNAPVANWDQRPTDGYRFPSYVLSNNRANIKQAKEQLAKAEQIAERREATDGPTELASGDGWVLIEDLDDGRVRFIFDGKPDAEVRALLKTNGFRWAPSVGAWQRQNTANGIAVAKRVAEQI